MKAAEVRKLVDRHLAAEAAHDATRAAACYAADGFYVNLALGLRFDGRTQVEYQYGASYAAMPDLALRVDGEALKGSRLAQWGLFTGTVAGSFLGLAATNRRISVPLVAVYEFALGAIKSETLYYDLATFCDQAGLEVSAVQAAIAALPPTLRMDLRGR